eukprot:gene3159-13172_t
MSLALPIFLSFFSPPAFGGEDPNYFVHLSDLSQLPEATSPYLSHDCPPSCPQPMDRYYGNTGVCILPDKTPGLNVCGEPLVLSLQTYDGSIVAGEVTIFQTSNYFLYVTFKMHCPFVLRGTIDSLTANFSTAVYVWNTLGYREFPQYLNIFPADGTYTCVSYSIDLRHVCDPFKSLYSFSPLAHSNYGCDCVESIRSCEPSDLAAPAKPFFISSAAYSPQADRYCRDSTEYVPLVAMAPDGSTDIAWTAKSCPKPPPPSPPLPPQQPIPPPIYPPPPSNPSVPPVGPRPNPRPPPSSSPPSNNTYELSSPLPTESPPRKKKPPPPPLNPLDVTDYTDPSEPVAFIPSAPPNPVLTSGGGGSSNSGAIAGGIVAAVVGSVAIMAAVWYYARRRRNTRNDAMTDEIVYQSTRKKPTPPPEVNSQDSGLNSNSKNDSCTLGNSSEDGSQNWDHLPKPSGSSPSFGSPERVALSTEAAVIKDSPSEVEAVIDVSAPNSSDAKRNSGGKRSELNTPSTVAQSPSMSSAERIVSVPAVSAASAATIGAIGATGMYPQQQRQRHRHRLSGSGIHPASRTASHQVSSVAPPVVPKLQPTQTEPLPLQFDTLGALGPTNSRRSTQPYILQPSSSQQVPSSLPHFATSEGGLYPIPHDSVSSVNPAYAGPFADLAKVLAVAGAGRQARIASSLAQPSTSSRGQAGNWQEDLGQHLQSQHPRMSTSPSSPRPDGASTSGQAAWAAPLMGQQNLHEGGSHNADMRHSGGIPSTSYSTNPNNWQQPSSKNYPTRTSTQSDKGAEEGSHLRPVSSPSSDLKSIDHHDRASPSNERTSPSYDRASTSYSPNRSHNSCTQASPVTMVRPKEIAAALRQQTNIHGKLKGSGRSIEWAEAAAAAAVAAAAGAFINNPTPRSSNLTMVRPKEIAAALRQQTNIHGKLKGSGRSIEWAEAAAAAAVAAAAGAFINNPTPRSSNRGPRTSPAGEKAMGNRGRGRKEVVEEGGSGEGNVADSSERGEQREAFVARKILLELTLRRRRQLIPPGTVCHLHLVGLRASSYFARLADSTDQYTWSHFHDRGLGRSRSGSRGQT